LLGEVTGILITSTLAGLILDKLWHYDPIGLGIGVIVGSLASTGLVLRKVTTEIENG
jgi:F0F1-type ATP synthase assembly protein I